MFLKNVTFQILDNKSEKFVIERDEKYGGNLEFSTYEELERLYAKKEIHPADLKNAMARELNKVLEPIRNKFNSDKKIQFTYKQAYPKK